MTWVFAFDPGVMTGFSAWNGHELCFTAQGSVEDVLSAWLPTIKTVSSSARDSLVVIEDAFVGKGAHASLSVAKAGGFIDGALWCAGVRSPRWQPIAGQWRKPFKWPGTRPDLSKPKGKRRSARADYEEDARDLALKLTGRKFDKSQTHVAEAIVMGLSGVMRCKGKSIYSAASQ